MISALLLALANGENMSPLKLQLLQKIAAARHLKEYGLFMDCGDDGNYGNCYMTKTKPGQRIVKCVADGLEDSAGEYVVTKWFVFKFDKNKVWYKEDDQEIRCSVKKVSDYWR